MGCNKIQLATIDETVLNRLELSDFILPVSNDISFGYIEKGKTYEITNVVNLGFNADQTFYAFLSTESNNTQTLLVIDKNRNIFTWANFYPETSHLYRKNMVACIISPFPERHLEEEIRVIDFYNNKDFFRINSFKRASQDENLQESYYLYPYYSKIEEGLELNIFWEQAHYPMEKLSYFLDSKDVWFSSNDDDYSITELIEDTRPIELSENTVLKNLFIVCEEKIGETTVAVVLDQAGSLEWQKYRIITASKTDILNENSLASIFRYQDPLVSIKPAIPVDSRAAFIVETKEFSYDMYFDSSNGETDIYLRPSSFVTRYPH